MFCEHGSISYFPVVVSKSGPRCKIDLKELDHFLSFITSPYIMQELPFREKFLKFSSGEVLETRSLTDTLITFGKCYQGVCYRGRY